MPISISGSPQPVVTNSSTDDIEKTKSNKAKARARQTDSFKALSNDKDTSVKGSNSQKIDMLKEQLKRQQAEVDKAKASLEKAKKAYNQAEPGIFNKLLQFLKKLIDDEKKDYMFIKKRGYHKWLKPKPMRVMAMPINPDRLEEALKEAESRLKATQEEYNQLTDAVQTSEETDKEL